MKQIIVPLVLVSSTVAFADDWSQSPEIQEVCAADAGACEQVKAVCAADAAMCDQLRAKIRDKLKNAPPDSLFAMKKAAKAKTTTVGKVVFAKPTYKLGEAISADLVLTEPLKTWREKACNALACFSDKSVELDLAIAIDGKALETADVRTRAENDAYLKVQKIPVFALTASDANAPMHGMTSELVSEEILYDQIIDVLPVGTHTIAFDVSATFNNGDSPTALGHGEIKLAITAADRAALAKSTKRTGPGPKQASFSAEDAQFAKYAMKGVADKAVKAVWAPRTTTVWMTTKTDVLENPIERQLQAEFGFQLPDGRCRWRRTVRMCESRATAKDKWGALYSCDTGHELYSARPDGYSVPVPCGKASTYK